MKLKTRLIIGFITVMLLPLSLSIFVITIFGQFQIRSIEKNYGITGADYKILTNPINALSKITEPTFQKLSITINRDASRMEDEKFLEEINEELQSLNSFLVVRREEDLVYQGKDVTEDVEQELPEFGTQDSSAKSGIYIGGSTQALIKQLDFFYSDGGKGVAFIVTDVNAAIPEVRQYITNMLISIILILAATAGGMIIWIYRGVSIPLGKMKDATQKIKEGNLDFELKVETEDEIGQLCRDFEEMRVRLKDNAEEKLENDLRSKELISNISHDLKTPITAIKGYVEGIMDGVADTPEKMDRYIRTIYNKANDMDLLINELTLYSKIDANRIPYDFKTLLVNEYFDDCAVDLKIDIESRGITFEYSNYVETSVRIIADPEQLKRVINNIISNATKYMDKPNKMIHLRVKDVGDFIQVEIEDNGKGIGMKELPNIFERFYRTDASRNSATGGSGIGLSIVKKIIEEHGGNIWATSKEGIGTIMCFVIHKYQEVPVNE